MRTVQEKIDSLNSKSVWYFAKQDTNFDHSFVAARVFDSIPNKCVENISDYFEKHVGEYGILPNHRILSVAQMFGMITKSTPYRHGGKYNEENTTPVFAKLNSYPMGMVEYNRLKTQQLLKFRIQTITDTRTELTDYGVSPFLFTLEVLFRLHKIGIHYISLENFYTYVMTSKNQNEVEEVVFWLQNGPQPSKYVETYINDSRVIQILRENISALDFSPSTIRIAPSFMNIVSSMFDGDLKGDVDKILKIMNNKTCYPQSLITPMDIDINLV